MKKLLRKIRKHLNSDVLSQMNADKIELLAKIESDNKNILAQMELLKEDILVQMASEKNEIKNILKLYKQTIINMLGIDELVFYGPSTPYFEKAYAEFIKKGCKPLCVASDDQDFIGTKTKKHEVDIVSVDDMLTRYPMAEIYITSGPPGKYWVMDMLQRKGVPASQIINYEPYINVRACRLLLKEVLSGDEGDVLFHCEYFDKTKQCVINQDEIEKCIKMVKQKLLIDISDGKQITGHCKNCPENKNVYLSAFEYEAAFCNAENEQN